MTQKRFKFHEHQHYGDGIEDTTKPNSIMIDSLYQCCELMNELNDENIKLKKEIASLQK